MKNNKIKYECSCFQKTNCAHILAVEHTNGKDITNVYKYNKTNLSATVKKSNNNQITGRKNKGHEVNTNNPEIEKTNHIIEMAKQNSSFSRKDGIENRLFHPGIPLFFIP